ncbi:MAG: polysaccharide deacetylase family protein, partial [bacterium]
MNSIPRRIYLTFDDGPEGDFTLKVLDLLRDWGAKATFFVCGKNCEIFPHILKREVEEGHSIGNHTYSHNRLLVYLGLIKGEVERTRRIICELTGREVNLFRPPWGVMVPWLRWYLIREGYRLVFWDIDTRDWSGIKGEE